MLNPDERLDPYFAHAHLTASLCGDFRASSPENGRFLVSRRILAAQVRKIRLGQGITDVTHEVTFGDVIARAILHGWLEDDISLAVLELVRAALA